MIPFTMVHERQRGKVFTFSSTTADPIDHYQRVRNEGFARRLAQIREQPFAGEYPGIGELGSYIVPHKTLVGVDVAQQLGIHSPDDLFGGVVPFPYQATKSLTHRLVPEPTVTPEGWSQEFADISLPTVLNGYSAFNREDAMKAGQMLLADGSVRVKQTLTTCGLGQTIVSNTKELADAIDALPQEEINKFGVVLEENLHGEVATYSIGTTVIDGIQVSYIGLQRKTQNNSQQEEYGGSDLTLIRGGLEALKTLSLDEDTREAIEKVRQYDAAAQAIPGFIASRRNYDVIHGFNAKGEKRIGVLEPSFRIGGASSPEILATEIFKEKPEATIVKASSYHRFGQRARVPSDAIVFYNDIDPEFGPMKIYAIVHDVQ